MRNKQESIPIIILNFELDAKDQLSELMATNHSTFPQLLKCTCDNCDFAAT